MSDYKPNSHKYREGQSKPPEKREIKPVIKGTAKIKKKSEIRKFADVFVAEDASNVKSYIIDNMVIPGVKKLFVGIICTAAEMIFGEQGYGRNGQGGRGGSYISYGDRYGRREERNVSAAKPRFDYNDILFETRGEAEAVLRAMWGSIDDYGYVTIADMYDFADLTAPPFTSVKYGWKDLTDAHIVRTFDGAYMIKLPRATQLN